MAKFEIFILRGKRSHWEDIDRRMIMLRYVFFFKYYGGWYYELAAPILSTVYPPSHSSTWRLETQTAELLRLPLQHQVALWDSLGQWNVGTSVWRDIFFPNKKAKPNKEGFLFLSLPSRKYRSDALRHSSPVWPREYELRCWRCAKEEGWRILILLWHCSAASPTEHPSGVIIT